MTALVSPTVAPATVAFLTVDVFTRERFGGNQLAVFPDARGLSSHTMGQIAAEMNYSETSFVLPPDDPRHTARVRIFTPRNEIPFAGHPNVGTGYILGTKGRLFGEPVGNTLWFEEAGGLVEVRLSREEGRVTGASIRAPEPLVTGAEVDVDLVAGCASLPPEEVRTAVHRPLIGSVGLPFAIVELESVDALTRARANAAIFDVCERRYRLPEDRFSLFLYARSPDGNGPDLRARMFAPLSGTLEDPATGSASAALGALLSKLDAGFRGRSIELLQGVEMGRPSLIRLSTEFDAQGRVWATVSGECRATVSGVVSCD